MKSLGIVLTEFRHTVSKYLTVSYQGTGKLRINLQRFIIQLTCLVCITLAVVCPSYLRQHGGVFAVLLNKMTLQTIRILLYIPRFQQRLQEGLTYGS